MNPRNVWCSSFGTGKCFLFEHGGRCVFCVPLSGLRAPGRPSGGVPLDVDVPISVKAVNIMLTVTPASGPACLKLCHSANVHNPKSPPNCHRHSSTFTSPNLTHTATLTVPHIHPEDGDRSVCRNTALFRTYGTKVTLLRQCGLHVGLFNV